jgi:hypothetical protein
MAPRITLRRATLADLGTLVAHRRAMFVDMDPSYATDALDEADRAYRAWARRLMRKGEYVAWIAEARGAG